MPKYRAPAIGSVTKVRLKEDLLLCRVGTPRRNNPDGLGQFLSIVKVETKEQARQLFAICDEWNDCRHVVQVRIKAGTEIYISKAGPQQATEGTKRFYPGGGVQVFVEDSINDIVVIGPLESLP